MHFRSKKTSGQPVGFISVIRFLIAGSLLLSAETFDALIELEKLPKVKVAHLEHDTKLTVAKLMAVMMMHPEAMQGVIFLLDPHVEVMHRECTLYILIMRFLTFNLAPRCINRRLLFGPAVLVTVTCAPVFTRLHLPLGIFKTGVISKHSILYNR
jgi:hypothetical protein